MNKFKKLAVCAVGAGAMVVATAQAKAYDFVTVTGGVVAFEPEGLVTPLITAIVAIVGAVAAIWIIIAGVSYLRRFLG